MKKHHILLALLILGIAAFFLNESRKLQNSESIVSEELNMLRGAVKKSPGAATASSLTGKGTHPPAIDAKKFTVDLTDFLKAGPSSEKGKGLDEFMTAYESQLNTAPLAKLKEICALLEKNLPFGQADTEAAQLVWFGVVRLAAKSDPAWAFAKLDQAASTTKIPIQMQLRMFKSSLEVEENPMGRAYATAMQKWLDAAQAAGRIEATDPLVMEFRADIAAAQGDPSAAVKQIAQLPGQSQRKAAIDYVQGLQTPEARRQALEELSTVMDINNFPHFVKSLTDQQGFDAAKEILGSASLTPEKHDLAAATIAAAKIGPDTIAHAAWLLESLRSDDPRALHEFANNWAHGDFTAAAKWMNTLPVGPKLDAAVSGFAPAAAKIDGATAADWAHTITDPLQRNRTLCEVLSVWREQDSAAAEAYYTAKPIDSAALEAASKRQEK